MHHCDTANPATSNILAVFTDIYAARYLEQKCLAKSLLEEPGDLQDLIPETESRQRSPVTETLRQQEKHIFALSALPLLRLLPSLPFVSW